jgi:hypothetical protein
VPNEKDVWNRFWNPPDGYLKPGFDVEDHAALRKTITAAQRHIGQSKESKGGNGSRRIKMHVKYQYFFDAVEFLGGLLVNKSLRMDRLDRSDELGI